jgi:hypothetical protein
MSSLLSSIIRWTQRFADHPIYPFIAGLIAALDYLVPGAPTNAFLVASVLPRRSQWGRLGVAFAIGDAIGALVLASAIVIAGGPVVAWIQGGEAADLWGQIASSMRTVCLHSQCSRSHRFRLASPRRYSPLRVRRSYLLEGRYCWVTSSPTRPWRISQRVFRLSCFASPRLRVWYSAMRRASSVRLPLPRLPTCHDSL